jgi:endoribonuclease Dicer
LTIDFGCSNYCVKAGEVPFVDDAAKRIAAAVIIHDEVVAEGMATSTRYAKIKASEEALVILEGLPTFKFREKYRCDCRENAP